MKKIKFFLAAMASVALVSCMNDEFVGNSPGTTAEEENVGEAIAFSSGSKAMTRATSNDGTVAQKLDGQFKVLGVKNVAAGWKTVFNNYIVWNDATKSISNPDGDWEYVGESSQTYGSGSATIGSKQTAKYWDNSATSYRFVAGSPVASFTYHTSDGNITSATVTGIAGHINANTSGTAITTNPVYIANPVIVNPTSGVYNNIEVGFNFIRQQSFVRVGVYETIPGYRITDIKFYQYNESSDAWTDTKTSNITLASKTANYFTGATNAQAAVSYTWTGADAPKYTYAYESGLTQQKNWFGGKLTGVPATTSTEATVANLYGTDDMGTKGYFTVMPTPTNTDAAAILIKCDYTLTAEDDNAETITVTGATAAIPAAFCKWAPNTSYTYLFKITDKELYPITFDAVVVDASEYQGTITTVSTPSITTYQEGSVTTEGIKYVADKQITATVTNDATGDVLNISGTTTGVGYVQVYSLGTTEKTETDLQITRPTGGMTIDVTSNKLSFTPDAAGYYAIEYQTTTAPSYTYKVVHVQ